MRGVFWFEHQRCEAEEEEEVENKNKHTSTGGGFYRDTRKITTKPRHRNGTGMKTSFFERII